MRIDLTKAVYSPREARFIVAQLQQGEEKGYLEPRSENNPYLLASYKGVEARGISPKWNIKVYEYSLKTKGHSLVCVDKQALKKLLEEDYLYFTPPDLPVVRIDDAGWGFPLCGVMVGVADEQKVITGVVPVEYFRKDTVNHFQTKKYLQAYADMAVVLLGRLAASPATHRIEICTGFLNQPLREQLRLCGYDVRVVEVKGLLQDRLEELFKEYIFQEIGLDLYYDPKLITKAEIASRYHACLAYGQQHCPEKIKTGWSALSGIKRKGRAKR